MSSNWRQYLGYGPTNLVTEADVKTKYKRLALRLHPNKNPGKPRATENFQEMQKIVEAALLYAQTARQNQPQRPPPPRQRTPPPPPRQRTPPPPMPPRDKNFFTNYSNLISRNIPSTFFIGRHMDRMGTVVYRCSVHFPPITTPLSPPVLKIEMYDKKTLQWVETHPTRKIRNNRNDDVWTFKILFKEKRKYSFSLKFNPNDASISQWIPLTGEFGNTKKSEKEFREQLVIIAARLGINMIPYVSYGWFLSNPRLVNMPFTGVGPSY